MGIGGAPRQATARRLIVSARQARDRIAAGIDLIRADPHARVAFRAMNEAVARAARQREAILSGGDPSAQRRPKWRPFLHVTFTAPQHESWRHFVDLAYWNVELSD